MTAALSEAQVRLVQACEGMCLTARRLRQELDRVLIECLEGDLLHLERRGASQALVTTSSLLMVLQADVVDVLEAQAKVSAGMLAEARTVFAAVRAQIDGHEGERPPFANTGADSSLQAG